MAEKNHPSSQKRPSPSEDIESSSNARPPSPQLDPNLPTNGSAVKVKWSSHDGRCKLPHATSVAIPAAFPTTFQSRMSLDQFPAEVIHKILSYLVHPRSRLAGRTEALSAYDCPAHLKRAAREAYYADRTRAPDDDRWVVDLFSWGAVRHPFNELSFTSRRMRQLVENYCEHLVRMNNRFNLPFAIMDQHPNGKVYPDMSGTVYRRLWLQYAPRRCIYCDILLSEYPHDSIFGLMMACQICFYDQVYTLGEVEAQFHLSWMDLHYAGVRSSPRFYTFILRCDVEALALKLYGTRAFHNTSGSLNSVCSICTQAGTLQRIMQLRGGLGSHDGDDDYDGESGSSEEEGDEEEGEEEEGEGWVVARGCDAGKARKRRRWAKYLTMYNDPYHYREEDNVEWGYWLTFEGLH